MPDSEVFNPYAPPKSLQSAATEYEPIRFDGECLIVPREYTFPAICLKTGETTGLAEPRTQKFTWVPPIGFAISAKKGEIRYHLTREVALKRAKTTLTVAALLAVGIVFGFLSAAFNSAKIALACPACLLLGIVVGLMTPRFLWVKRIDKTHLWLRGVPDHVARKIVNATSQP